MEKAVGCKFEYGLDQIELEEEQNG